MSRRRITTNSDAPGSDSFLDIVANMVGIMIILVMVVGVQAKDAFIAAPTEQPASNVAAPHEDAQAKRREAQLQAKQSELATLKSEVDELAKAAAYTAGQTELQLAERNELQKFAVAAEQLIQEERAKLDEQQRTDFDLRRQLATARDELEDLSAAQLAVENTAAPVVQLKHLPTPMAKTVFGREEHFQLSGGRLVYVPMNQLVEEMKQQAELKIYKLKQTAEITETIGPIGGYTMKYTLVRRSIEMRNGAVREVVDLDGFVLVPGSASMGEPLEHALREGSDFRNRLAQFEPNTTTITVWTYPDSFGAFRQVKDTLYELGFLTAGRPMPEGHPIGGSPSGSRSGAQ